MPFSPDVKIRALVACGRCCCICHKFCGIKIECHHIVQEANGGPNTIENCIPLCFDCHADMLSYDDNHPKGTKYRPEELRFHRDSWFTKVCTARPADYTAEHLKLDQSLFKRILRLLPWNGSIGFINTNNFAGFSFECSSLRDLNDFDACNEDPGWEFIDPTLEVVRATLAQHVSRFLGLIAVNTFPTHNSGRSSVPQEWEDQQPERFANVVQDIHETAQQCVDSYRTLIREGRHRLAVGVPIEEANPNEPMPIPHRQAG
jgi:HNH endonuclease